MRDSSWVMNASGTSWAASAWARPSGKRARSVAAGASGMRMGNSVASLTNSATCGLQAQALAYQSPSRVVDVCPDSSVTGPSRFRSFYVARTTSMHPSCLPTGQFLLRTRASPPGPDMTERQRASCRVRRVCAAGRRVAGVALADPYMSVWQGTVSAGPLPVVRICGTAGVTVGRIDRVPGSEDGRFERGGPGRTCDGAG